MNMQQIIDAVRGFDGALIVLPDAAPHPELSWGDAYFFYAPDGVIPQRTQPYGTIITKNYPDDIESQLDSDGRFRVNIHTGAERAERVVEADAEPADADVLVRHPLYGSAGWVSVVNPAERTSAQVLALLAQAHDDARARTLRRAGRRA